MFRYLFCTRGSPLGELLCDGWLDVTPLLMFRSDDEFTRAMNIMRRMGEPSVELESLRASVSTFLGTPGQMRRRMNQLGGPYMVVWEEVEPLTPEQLEGFLNGMNVRERAAWLQRAKFNKTTKEVV